MFTSEGSMSKRVQHRRGVRAVGRKGTRPRGSLLLLVFDPVLDHVPWHLIGQIPRDGPAPGASLILDVTRRKGPGGRLNALGSHRGAFYAFLRQRKHPESATLERPTKRTAKRRLRGVMAGFGEWEVNEYRMRGPFELVSLSNPRYSKYEDSSSRRQAHRKPVSHGRRKTTEVLESPARQPV